MNPTTYKQLNPNDTAAFGTKGSQVAKLQNELNAKGANLKVDSLYGPLTQAAYNQYMGAPTTNTNTTNPVITSNTVKNKKTAVGNEIDNLINKYGVGQDTGQTSLKDLEAKNNSLIESRMNELKRYYDADMAGIRSSYEEASRLQKDRQNKDYAGRATGLITSGGGFLGTTQSQQGVLQNLKNQHETEQQSLMAKRDAALLAASQSFSDNNFQLAMSQLKEAKDTEKELYQRQKDFAQQSLDFARENRAQTEFDMGITDKKIEAYSMMEDAEFNNIDKNEIAKLDAMYFPGYTDTARKLAKQETKNKSLKEQQDWDIKLLSALRQIPAGQKVTIGGKTYVGMKQASGGSTKGGISSSLATQLGVPSLAGKDESDVILSLNLQSPPTWYKEFYQISDPTNWEIVKNNPEALKMDWLNFTEQPDIKAYKNSGVVTKRIEDDGNSSSFNIDEETITKALQEIGQEI